MPIINVISKNYLRWITRFGTSYRNKLYEWGGYLSIGQADISSYLFDVKIVDKKSKLGNFGADRMKSAEWNVCRSYIIRYEVILQVKLSYFNLLKDN